MTGRGKGGKGGLPGRTFVAGFASGQVAGPSSSTQPSRDRPETSALEYASETLAGARPIRLPWQTPVALTGRTMDVYGHLE